MCSAPFKNDVVFFPHPFILASCNNDMTPEGSECFVHFFFFFVQGVELMTGTNA